MAAYYNENDPFAVAWLRELIRCGHIADGDVDERSITEVKPADVQGFTQCHFFAGIGVWSYSLRCAGWPEDQRVWTGSCPCQPFSVSGKRGGASDGRHLWPVWSALIRECRPECIFGEQVASDDGLAWLDLVSSDLENADYTVGAVDICAAGVGAPHIRQRLYFVAESADARCTGTENAGTNRDDAREGARCSKSERISNSRQLGEPYSTRSQSRRTASEANGYGSPALAASCIGDVGNAESGGREIGESFGEGTGSVVSPSFWSDADWLPCRDGKARPVEPGTFPLAYGATRRVGRLRGYGNAIVAPQAEKFVRAYLGWRVSDGGQR